MIILAFIIVILDQLTKYYAVSHLAGKEPFIIIKDFFQFSYVENRGAAFGILQEQRLFFIMLTLIVILGIIVYTKINKKLSKASKTSLGMILGGAVGNFIDRLRLGYVIDFIDFKFGKVYDFPVFNIADIFIVIGTFLLMYLIITDKYEK
ncbi:lipoprotein signal peptidase LspA [Gottschalkia purinilytica]|uniref:Lipoprotein signal peptidase n=1 Tax=Gottschalkia purinilytica TaxID=1503 RepID=A0A0L0WBB9_GOTPU|nr:signal peptidase II [Gottschalkia purinilytica]KNF08727.1 lipoprotein signal peptidase LspA [Gottschalkia purinilytica]